MSSMPSHPLNIVISLPTEESDYQQAEAKAAKDAAHRYGFNITVIFAEGDALTQSQQLLSIIHSSTVSRPDVIMLEPVGTGMVRVAQEAVKAGIGWVILNREVDYMDELRAMGHVPAFAVTTNHLETGRIQGRQLNALLPEGGSVIYLQGPNTNPVSQVRATGMMETKHPHIQVRTLNGHWLETTAAEAVSAWLRLPTSRDLHLRVVAAQNDFMAMGARKAFVQLADQYNRKDWLEIQYLGCDGLENYGSRWAASGQLAATIVCPPLSPIAMEILAKEVIQGVRAPACIVTAPISYPALGQLGTA
jgi:ribose transport system substrate-binding protein